MLKENKGFQVSKIESDNFRKGVYGYYEAKRYNCFVNVENAEMVVDGLIYKVVNPKVLIQDISKIVGISSKDLKQALFNGKSLIGVSGRIKGIEIKVVEKTENGFICESQCDMYLLLQE